MKETNNDMKFSNQALGAIMMALQESLMNELDIVPILRNFDLVMTNEGLMVKNPPTVRVGDGEQIAEQDLLNMVNR